MAKKIKSSVVRCVGASGSNIRVFKVIGGYRISRNPKLFTRKVDAIAKAELTWSMIVELREEFDESEAA